VYFPYLPQGRAYFAVIDVEAIVLQASRNNNTINIVEQVAIVLIDQWGREAFGAKYMVYQPMDTLQIASSYRVDIDIVNKSSDAYKRITGDNPVHRDLRRYEKWSTVRKRIMQLCRDYALVVYAKGISLENSVFYGELDFHDLAWYNCPKFPLALHDPLVECRFFAQYIPETNPRPFYVFQSS
jgi:hypothetical protein